MSELPEPDDRHAQVARARTRDSVPQTSPRAHAPRGSATESPRSAVEQARQRWNRTAPTAPPVPPTDDQVEPGDAGSPTPSPTPTPAPQPPAPLPPGPIHPSPFSSYSDSSQPLRATWATYRAHGAQVKEFSPILVVPYWLGGLIFYGLHCLFRLGQDSTTSLVRSLALVAVLGIFTIGIVILL